MNKNYPVKQDLNLAQREKQRREIKRVVITALVLIAAIGVFTKFAVVDRLSAVRAAEAEAMAAEQKLAQAMEATKNYDQVLDEYQTYTLAHKAVSEGADPLDCLDMVEEQLMAKSLVYGFEVSPQIVAVELSGVTLEEVSRIYASLMAHEMVENVQVYTAATVEENLPGEEAGEPVEDEEDTATAVEMASRVSASMIIRLQAEGEEAAS